MTNLAWLLLLANTLSAIAVLLQEFARRGGYVTLPFLTSLMFLIWYLPQAWAVSNYAVVAPESLVRLFFMSLICFWALVLGWQRGLGHRWRRPQQLDLPVKKLYLPVFFITVFALAMHTLIEFQPVEDRIRGFWTGPITIIAFFASISVVSLALSAAMVMKRFDVFTIVLFALNLAIYLPRIFIYFRRADMFEFVLALMLGLLFVRQFAIPRIVIVLGAIASLFVVNGVGQLRALGGGYHLSASGTIETRLPTLAELAEIDWIDVVEQSDRVSRSEVMNAVVGMETIAYYSDFTLGAQFWNRLILAYVPGQIVGHSFKQSLMMSADAITLARFLQEFEKQPGTTSTGFSDTYHDFWFFGCIVWWLTGYVSGRFMRSALRGGFLGYILYAATITNAVHVTTHFGYYLFSQSVLILLSILLLRSWLRRKNGCVRIPRVVAERV